MTIKELKEKLNKIGVDKDDYPVLFDNNNNSYDGKDLSDINNIIFVDGDLCGNNFNALLVSNITKAQLANQRIPKSITIL